MEIALRNIVVLFSLGFLLATCGNQSERDMANANQPTDSKSPKDPSNGKRGADRRSPVAVSSEMEQDQGRYSSIDLPTSVSEKPKKNDRIYFSDNKTAVDEQDQELLRRHASLLKENSRLTLILVVFTDNQGSRTYNLALTEKWIDSIVRTLRAFGIQKKQIRIVNAGRRKNYETCTTPSCRRQIQRVELIYKN